MTLRISCVTVLLATSAALSPTAVYAQAGQGGGEAVLPLSVRPSDRQAAFNASDLRVHLTPARTDHAKPFAAAAQELNNPEAASLPEVQAATNPALPPLPAGGFYPFDLSSHGGPVVKSAQSHNVYINAAPSTWGNPAKFLADFGNSTLAHVLDQYAGSTANNRYTVGVPSKMNLPALGNRPPNNTLGDNDLLQIVHTAASTLGVGYGHIYHVFLPPGVNFCRGMLTCYSPDDVINFTFCAFHGSVNFKDIGHVLFSVEPFQNVPMCAEPQPNPNGAVADSTYSALSRELAGAITDPDANGWFAGQASQEIVDQCQTAGVDPVSILNGSKYQIQLLYSNKSHACVNIP